VLGRLIICLAAVLALTASDALADMSGRGGVNHRRGPHGAAFVRGNVYYVLPYAAYPYAYAPYAYPGQYYSDYVPENATYCDPNSHTYIDEDGARHLCR
jgi:hypothetical protein